MKWLTILIASWSSVALADGALSRQQVVGAMSALRPQLAACYAKYRVAGVAVVDLTIAPAGTVSAATLQPPGHGGDIAPASPTGACVVQAVRTARFPAFAGAPLTLSYPLVVDEHAPAAKAPPPSAAIARAEQAYIKGRYAEAIERATAARADDPPRAWRIIGAASCFRGDAAGAAAARDALDGPARRFVEYVCSVNNVVLPAR